MFRLWNDLFGWVGNSLVFGGIISSTTIHGATRFVNGSNPNPAPPYTTWATAATAIQDAIEAASPGDEILVTNGVYQAGGKVIYGSHMNRVAIDKPVRVASVNGPKFTMIRGDGPPLINRRCVYMTNGAALSGFTITAGKAIQTGSTSFNGRMGGGIYCESQDSLITDCILEGNTALDWGGGVMHGTLVNCVITGNVCDGQGGGAYNSTLINCTVVGNSADLGGGIVHGTASNCIVYFNASSPFPHTNYLSPYTKFVNSCTTPLPDGTGNISDDPLFVNVAEKNFRLQSNSPCVNAGDSSAVTSQGDLEGSPRIVDGVVDMGAFEFQHLPVIVLQPQSQGILVQSNVTFTASAVGEEPLVYRWQKDGVDLEDDSRISGASGTSLTISNLVVADGGKYRVVVTNHLGTATSTEATLSILGPPSISIQPTNQVVSAGANVTFDIIASGLTTLSYQWFFEDSPLTNATNNLVALTNVQSGNAGDYFVIISNSYGMATSVVATLTVVPSPPVITIQPISRVASLQQNIAFSIAAKGTEPLTCQWRKNGSDIPGATNFTLNIPNVQNAEAGIYRAVVSNAVGFVESDEATLSVVPILVWGRTNSNTLEVPAAATNVVAMTAAFDALYALRDDGTVVGWGRTNAPVDATNLVAIAASHFQQISTLIGVNPDGAVRIWGTTSPTFTNIPPDATNVVALAAGGSHVLALRGDGSVVTWGGTGALTNIPAAATNVIGIAAGSSYSLALRADGTVVSWGLNRNKHQNVLSNAVNVASIAAGAEQLVGLLNDGTVLGYMATNGAPPGVFYGDPPDNATNILRIAAGNSHTIGLRPDSSVVGWGANVFPGITNIPSYATNVVAIAAGSYHSLALVRDPLTPIPPRIGREPLSRTAEIGETIVVHGLVLGAMPLNYQWSFEGELLPAQTNSWLVLTNVQFNQAGDYQLIVSNDFGSVTSAVATLTLNVPAPVISDPELNESGLSFSFFALDGSEYVLEFKSIVDDATWQQSQVITGAGAIVTVTNSLPPLEESRFYRVRVK